MNGQAVTRNALWLMGGRLLQTLLHMVLGLMAARRLGPDSYGLLTQAAAYAALFAPLCSLGLGGILVRELGDLPEKSGEILGTAMVLRGGSSFLSAGVMLWLMSALRDGDPALRTLVVLSNLAMTVQTAAFFQCWFQSRLQMRQTVQVTLAAAMVSAGYQLWLLWTGKDVVWFGAAALVEQLAAGMLLARSYYGHGGRKLGFSREMAGALLGKSCHFILPGLMVAVYGQTDKLMLGAMMGQAEVGYYGVASGICNGWGFVLMAVIDAAYPEITAAFRQDPAAFDRENRRLYGLCFYLAAGVSVMLCLLAKPLVWILYGAAYLPGVTALRILTWHTGFSYLGVARNPWVVCRNQQKYLIWCYVSAAVGNVGLNCLLVPRFGAAGAAAASLLAQVVTTMVVPFLLPGLRENGKLMLEAIALKGVFPGREGG